MVENKETHLKWKKPLFKRKTPASPELIEVGIIGCSPGGSHINSIYGPQINPAKIGDTQFIRSTGMRITYVWDAVQKYAEDFAKNYDVRKVESFDDMVGKVDAVMITDIFATPYYYTLAKPYLEAGIPLFLNRPFAYSKKNLNRLMSLIESCGTPVFYGDEFENVKETRTARMMVTKMEPILAVDATNSMSDYPSHGIHGINWILSCIGDGVERVSYQTPSWKKPNGSLIMEYAPRVEGGKTFYAALQQMMGGVTSASIRIYTKGGYYEDDLTWGEGRWYRTHFIFGPILMNFQRMIEEGRMIQSLENLRHRTEVFLAGFYSHVEKNGKPVALDSVPEEWTAPSLWESNAWIEWSRSV
ncbi:Gfo/Idh/MocA family oxidoreductase [Candidatus Omnitrophota bacterium]